MKKFRKALAVVMCVVMTLTAAPLNGFIGMELPDGSGIRKLVENISAAFDGFSTKAQAETYSGTCGDNLTWLLDTETGVLNISGTGAMTDWSYNSNAPWYSYRSYIKSVNIGNSVTSIGNYAFFDCTSLTSVTIGNSVTTIGNWAFEDCDSLTSVTIPDSVTTIGDCAFASCTSLTSVTIPDSVTIIGDYAFRDCTNLTSVTIPNSVTTIVSYAFYNCTSLTSVTIGNSVTTIGDYAFYNCESLTSVTIPDSVTIIGDYAFCDCTNLTSVTIPDSVITIGDYAFYGCNSLTSITIPDSVTTIGDRAFYSCDSLTSVTIPNSVTTIGESAFCGCNITNITIPNSVTTIGRGAFSNCTSLASVIIGNGVLSIGSSAFSDCNSLSNVTIPDSVTTIGDSAFHDCDSLTSVTIGNSVASIGSSAFSYCESLTSIAIATNNKYYSSDSYGVLFNKDKTTLIHYPEGNTRTNYAIPDSVTTIDNYAFSFCESLTSITIPDSVTTIGNGAFCGCKSLTSVTIPDSVTSISDGAFSSCYSLTSVTIPDSVITIGDSAFAFCYRLTSVVIPESVTYVGCSPFAGCNKLESISVDPLSEHYCTDEFGVLYTKDFSRLVCFPNGSDLQEYTVPAYVSVIGDSAFSASGKPDGGSLIIHRSNIKLERIIIPDSVTIIGDYAFALCNSLRSVVIGNSVTRIGERAFQDCDSLTSVTIPDSVKTIGDYAFAYCYKLTSVTIGKSVTTIGDCAFYRCTNLTSVTIPDSVTTISVYAFYGCGSLTDVYYTGTQEQWNKISIGSENEDLTSATIHYNSTGPNNALLFATGSSWNNVKNYRYTYSDSFFNYDSTKYHHDLAMMSLALEASACVPDGGWRQDASGNWVESGDDYSQKKPANAEILLDNIGFNTRKYYGYDQQPQYESVACVIASKNISTDTTVIAVAVRGGGYEAEWGGNFNIGKDSVEHTGFNNAKLGVLEYIEDFVSQNKNSFCGNVKFWIVGYSRAAATANLVAATFDSGLPDRYKNTKALGVTKNDLYCYGFETPLNTTDKNANSVTYNNIFSIANPIDPVTKVAPASKGFNFKRYGVTYYLPTQETISNYYGPNGIVAGMNAVHKKIYGEDYKENFNFLEFDLHLGVKINRSIGQMTYVNNLIDYVAVEGLKNREFYYTYIQDALVSIMAMLMGGYNTPNPDKLWDGLSESLQTYIHNREFISIHPLENLKHRIALVFDKHTEIIYSDAMAMLGKLDDVLMVLVKHPNYTLTTITNHKLLFYPHYGNVLVGWMAYLETLPEAQRNKLLSPSLKYRTVKVNCPVDVNVYDNEGNLVASIIDDEVISIDGEYLSTYIDENGQKCIVLPTDEEYRVEVTAREDCDVSCTIVETDGETLTDERIVNYYEIEMDADETITCTAENSEEVDVCNYPITDSNEDEISPNEILTADEIERFNINVKSNVDGVTVFGGGEYTKGEFAQIKAYDIGCYSFAGWYVDNELLSTDNEYRFFVTEDTEITAVFNEATLNWRTPTGDLHYGETNTFLAVAQNLPEGVNIRWESSGSLFELEPSEDGRSCNITGVGFGTNSISVSLVDADGNILLDADENEIKLQQLFTVAQREFTIKWNVNGTVTRQTVAETEAIVPNVNTDVAGYVFTGWYPEVPQTMPSYDLEFTAQYELLAKQLKIKNPTIKTVNYGDTLILHADFGETVLPEGYSILWTVEGAGFNMAPADDGLTCNMTSVANGNATVKATLVDENGETVLDANGNEMSDTQELKSNASFWQKIVSFFKNLFLINRIIPE